MGLSDALRDGRAASPNGDQPFPLDCRLADLAELGPGWPLLFELGFFLAVVCAVLLALQLPLLLLFAEGSGMGSWPSTAEHGAESSMLLSAGNLGPNGSALRLPGWMSHLSCLLLLLAGTYYGRRQNLLKTLYDDLEVEPMDYGLLLHGMPGQALDFWSDEGRVRQFVESCLGAEQRVEVVQVVLGYDVPRLQALIRDFQTLAQQGDEGAASSTPLLSSSLSQEEIQKILTTPECLREELKCHSCCVVVLRSQEDHRKVLKTWSTGWEKVLWLVRGTCSIAHSWGLLQEEMHFTEHSRLPQIDDRHPICIRRARAPTDLQWENFGATFSDCFLARLKTHVVMAGIFVAGFAAILAVESLAGGRTGGAWWQVLLRCSTLVVVNIAASSLSKRFSAQELHLTKTDQDDSLMVKLASYMAVNYTFLLIFLYHDPASSWYGVGGLLGTICVLMPTDTLVISLMAYYGIGSHLANLIKSYASPGDPISVAGMTQTQLNRLSEPKELNISRPLAHLIKSFLMCMFFLPFWPLGSLWMILSLVFKTYGYKKQLLCDSKRPYRQSHVIAFSALNFVYIGGLVYAFSAWWFLTPSLSGPGEDALTTFTPFLAMLSVYFLVAPRQLNNSFAGLFAPLVDGILNLVGIETGVTEGTDAGSHDYYVVQHHWDRSQKYHTASPAYQQLVRAMQAQKVPPPWNPETGDLQEPAAA